MQDQCVVGVSCPPQVPLTIRHEAETSHCDREDSRRCPQVYAALVASPLTTGTPRIDVLLSLLSLIRFWMSQPCSSHVVLPALPTLPHRVGNMVTSGAWGNTRSNRKDAASASPMSHLGRKGYGGSPAPRPLIGPGAHTWLAQTFVVQG